MRQAPALLLLAALACSTASRPDPAAKDRLVVLISVDGLAAFYLDDPKADLPTVRRMAREGARAEGMLCSFPTNTWPNHTTLVTGVPPGKHGVLANSYLDRDTGKVISLIPDPLFDKDEIVKVPTIYDLAHQAGLKTAAVIWPASRNARTLDWTMPDVKPLELFLKYSTPSWMEELRKAGIPVDLQEKWCNQPGGGVPRDWMYARAAAHAIRNHRPNLLLLHLVELDHVEHASGPRSPDAYWACSYADDRIRDVLEAVEAAGLRDRATFFVVSDHGFFPYSKSILPNVKLKQAGLVKVEGDKLVSRQAWVLPQGGGAFVYILDPARRKELLPRVKALLGEIEGVARVLDETEYGPLGLASPARDPRMGDLILSARSGYTFDGGFGGNDILVAKTGGTHGYLPDDPDLHATFVAWGAGVKKGVRLGVIPSLDVAPTIARLLGLRMENVDGRPRDEILER